MKLIGRQKNDPIASKELAIIALTRIYTLLQPYQTLTREIITPTLPAFITACIGLFATKEQTKTLTLPLGILETICDALSTLIPHFPATFRPFASQLRTKTRPYLVPTDSDSSIVPQSLSKACRNLWIVLHHVAAKSGGAEEWANLIEKLFKEFHVTADQIFRAVDQVWISRSGAARPPVNVDLEVAGGGSAPDEMPPWLGIHAGAQRLMGLFNFLSEYLQCPQKSAVTIPTSSYLDTISRVCLIARQMPNKQTWDQAVQINPAIEREERESLWSLMPDIHMAASRTISALITHLDDEILPLLPELLDHQLRVFKSGIGISDVRMASYQASNLLLLKAGKSMSKSAVESLDILIRACCRDLRQDPIFLRQPPGVNGTVPDTKKNGIAANADLFLKGTKSATDDIEILGQDHRAAACQLLTTLLSFVAQGHLRPSQRSLLDSTAILIKNREAMLASILNPYRDQRGRTYPSILPHFSQQYPDDQGLDILRTNLQMRALAPDDEEGTMNLDEVEDSGAESDDEMLQEIASEPELTLLEDTKAASNSLAHLSVTSQASAPVPANNPFIPASESRSTTTTTTTTIQIPITTDSPLKRKLESLDRSEVKELEHEHQERRLGTEPALLPSAVDIGDDSSDESVQLNMDLDDFDDDDEVEEGGEV